MCLIISCVSALSSIMFSLTTDRGWGYRRILTICDFHTPHSKHGEQFCNFWTYGFAFGINLSSLEGRLSALSQPRQTPRQTSRGVEDGMLFSAVSTNQFLFKTGKVQTYCCKQERGRHRTTKTNGRNQMIENISRYSSMILHVCLDMFGYTDV